MQLGRSTLLRVLKARGCVRTVSSGQGVYDDVYVRAFAAAQLFFDFLDVCMKTVLICNATAMCGYTGLLEENIDLDSVGDLDEAFGASLDQRSVWGDCSSGYQSGW